MIEGFFRNYMACEIGFGIIKRSFLQPKIIVTVVVAKLCRVTNFISTYKLGYANFSLNANSQKPYYFFFVSTRNQNLFCVLGIHDLWYYISNLRKIYQL